MFVSCKAGLCAFPENRAGESPFEWRNPCLCRQVSFSHYIRAALALLTARPLSYAHGALWTETDVPFGVFAQRVSSAVRGAAASPPLVVVEL